MEINTKKIGTFLKSIDGADYIYLEHTTRMRTNIENLIKRYALSKEYICVRFEINPKKYNDFTKGNYNYSLRDIATMEIAYVELEKKKIENDKLNKSLNFPEYKHKRTEKS